MFILYILREFIVGLMVGDMKEDGKIVICTEKVNILGKMVDIMRVITSMIKSMVMEYTDG